MGMSLAVGVCTTIALPAGPDRLWSLTKVNLKCRGIKIVLTTLVDRLPTLEILSDNSGGRRPRGLRSL